MKLNGYDTNYLYGSRFADSCVDFVIALDFSTKNHLRCGQALGNQLQHFIGISEMI